MITELLGDFLGAHPLWVLGDEIEDVSAQSSQRLVWVPARAVAAAMLRVSPSRRQAVPSSRVTAYAFSGTSRPVILSVASLDCRCRVRTATVSAAPARPWVPDTESMKSSALALRSW